jgi:hypothetical protein
MNPAELYTQLATQAPKRETPVVEPEFEMPELNDVEKQNLADFAESVYKQYEDLPMAQQLGLAVAPGTGEAISAYETKKFAEETKEAFDEGNYGETALKAGLTTLAALGSIPLFGFAARGTKAGAKLLSKNIDDIINKTASTSVDETAHVIDDVAEAVQKTTLDKVTPKNSVKAYKLFKVKNKKLFPLFVKMKGNKDLPVGKWIKSEAGELAKSGKVKSSAGELAYRPGFHAGEFPVATHIGGKVDPATGNRITDRKFKPNMREDNQVWAEVELPADVDYQSIANKNARIKKDGMPDARTAHITDRIPSGGFYKYNTNPRVKETSWLIGGEMKINRILKDDEVKAINQSGGVKDLPRRKELLNKDVEITEINKFNPTDKPRINPTQTEKGFINPKQLKNVPGESGEIRGAHRDIQGKDWEIFKKDIKEKGVQNPIHLNVDPGVGVRVSEGNHRLDAALEVGLDKIPFTRSSFGKAEQEFLNPDGTIKNVKRGTK